MVVADGFKDFARAILSKLVQEIAGRALMRSLVQLAAARPRPPCDAGEMQLLEYLQRQDWPTPVPPFDF